MSAFIKPPARRSNVIPLRPDMPRESPELVRERMRRADRRHQLQVLGFVALIFALSAVGLALLVLADRRWPL